MTAKKYKLLCLLTAISVILSLSVIQTYAKPTDITASSYVLMDAETGQVLYQKDMNDTAYPASITKIMTLLLAVENLNPDETTTVSKEAVIYGTEDGDTTNIALTSGEVMRIEDVEYGMFLASANDAANVLAEAVAGSNEEFAKLMNERAVQLGAKNTNFTNPHGLPDSNHVTSAYDMAVITKAAIQNDAFLKIASTVTYTIQPDNKKKETLPVASGLAMLKSTDPLYYDGILCGKTGYTVPAKYTGVAVAERNGIKLIVVVLGSSSGANRFKDMTALLDYGFENFVKTDFTTENVHPAKAEVIENDMIVATVAIKAPENTHYLRHIAISESEITFTPNIEKSYNQYDINPTVTLTVSNSEDMYSDIGTFPLSATVTQLSNPIAAKKQDETDIEQTDKEDTVKEKTEISSGLKIFLIILAVLSVLFGGTVILFAVSNIRRKKREKLRRKKRYEMYEKTQLERAESLSKAETNRSKIKSEIKK